MHLSITIASKALRQSSNARRQIALSTMANPIVCSGSQAAYAVKRKKHQYNSAVSIIRHRSIASITELSNITAQEIVQSRLVYQISIIPSIILQSQTLLPTK
jgi:hypothetical protein